MLEVKSIVSVKYRICYRREACIHIPTNTHTLESSYTGHWKQWQGHEQKLTGQKRNEFYIHFWCRQCEGRGNMSDLFSGILGFRSLDHQESRWWEQPVVRRKQYSEKKMCFQFKEAWVHICHRAVVQRQAVYINVTEAVCSSANWGESALRYRLSQLLLKITNTEPPAERRRSRFAAICLPSLC